MPRPLPYARTVACMLQRLPRPVTAGLAAGQDATPQPSAAPTTSENRVTSAVSFLGGAAVGLAPTRPATCCSTASSTRIPASRESRFSGIPFFAITHDGMSPRREFIIDSAGFWVQEATNEIILTRRPNLRHERAPFVKGVFAFNVLVSVGYAGAAFARAGPAERDTRGMAQSLAMEGTVCRAPRSWSRRSSISCATTNLTRAGPRGDPAARKSAGSR